MADIKFESVNVGREAEGHKLSQDWDSVNGRPVMDRPGTARLVFEDTAPAVSPSKDVRGYALPDGLLVLVIDATKADKAVNAERWRKLVPGGTYPHIACILATANALARERVDELI
jgi:hypothetical protein